MRCSNLGLVALCLIAAIPTSANAQAQSLCGPTGVVVSITPQFPSPGETIEITIDNSSMAALTLPNLCTFQAVYDNASCEGAPVFFPACPEVLLTIPPVGTHTWTWDQTDNMGEQVDAGTYYFDVQWVDPATGTSGGCCVPITIELGESACFGDGGDQVGCTPCPCGNEAFLGSRGGCKHSASDSFFFGSGAVLSAIGTESLAAADLCFRLTNAKPNSFGVLTSSETVAPANAANPCTAQNPGSGILSSSFDGLRCVVQGVVRHGARAIQADGSAGITSNGWGSGTGSFPGSASFVAGIERHFQVIYREDAGLVCGTEQNTSQRLSIALTP